MTISISDMYCKYFMNEVRSFRPIVTTLKCDAIVNAANSGMTGCYIPNHRCIDNAIHTFAGVELRLTCEQLMEQQGYPEPTGQAKITPAFNLPCRYVLHTVGPIISGIVTKEDKELLASCYRSCLELAAENDLESVAFCCISTGEFHFPNDLAAEIAVRTVKEYLKKQIKDVFESQSFTVKQKDRWGSMKEEKVSFQEYLQNYLNIEAEVKPYMDKMAKCIRDDVNKKVKTLFDDAMRSTLAENVFAIVSASDTYRSVSNSLKMLGN